MMDLSKLSDADFSALQAGNLAGMSDAGFGELLKQQTAAKSLPEKQAQAVETARRMYDPSAQMTGGELIAAGATKGVFDLGRGIKQMAGQMTPQEVDAQRAIDAPLMARPGARLGNFGSSAGIALTASLLPGGQTIPGALAYGGAQGALEPTGTDESRLRNALQGGLFGAAGQGGANALSRMLAPKVPQAAANLYNKRVPMTPGQRLGGGWNRAEEALTSIPVFGDVVKNARREAVIGFNSSVANEALAPIGKKLPAGLKGHDAVMFTERAIGQAYDDVLANVGNVTRDSQFATELASLRQVVKRSVLPKEVKSQFETAIKSQLDGKFQGQGVMTSQTYKSVESELGRLASKYQGDASVDKQMLGDALQEAQASLRSLLERSAGPQYAEAVRAANASWAQFKRMQRASTFLGAEDGVFSPENYLNAVKALDPSKDKGAFARGTALGQSQAQDAVNVLGRKVPDSGTPFRTLVSNPIKGSAAGLMSLPLLPVYKGRTSNVLQTLLSAPRPQSVQFTAKQLEDLAPLFGALGVAAGAGQ